ncbi:hypothetical protein PVA45_01590 [Entomospira entomophila]|uniref:Uncharacterized protein n=1 Tax=Entomospira entomophila TaxID=2719988 RepID=A0A968G7V4_9SPIO|nr:hypothetical protein [Entomospira entomophilus]NIZ40205.1 hypothetical protein [Entomospira entomophilus]WDI35764.1 hypothetical protein PVA45_01590 [Entomospira entomophilus]
MPKPVDVTKLTFENPIMVPYMVDGVEVDKQAELMLNEDALRAFIASETDRHNHYLTVVSIMMALFGIFGSVVAIGMGISLSLKERGIDQQLKDYEAKIEQGTKDVAIAVKNVKTQIEKEAQIQIEDINQEKDKVQEQFYYYVLENVKPALIHESIIEASDDNVQMEWKKVRNQFLRNIHYGYGVSTAKEKSFRTKLETFLEDIQNKQKSIYRDLAVDLLVMSMYIGNPNLNFMISLLNSFLKINEELTTMLFYQPLVSFTAQYVLWYKNTYRDAVKKEILDQFKQLDKVFVRVLEWLNAHKDTGRSNQELLAVNAIYEKVKAEVAEKKE